MRTLAIYTVMALVLACPSLAAAQKDQPEKEAKTAPTPFDYKAFSGEVAEHVRARALFNAEVTPQLQRALNTNAKERRIRYSLDEITNALWQLHAVPETQKKLLDAILTATGPEQQRKAIEEAFALYEGARQIARAFERRENQRRMDGRADDRMDGRAEHGKVSEEEYRARSMAARLEAEKRRMALMGQSIEVAALLKEADMRLFDAEEYIEPLLHLKGNPKALKAATALIRERRLPREDIRALLEKLATSPEAALADIANIEELKKIGTLFRFAMKVEGDEDMIKLPLASVMPKAAAELANMKTTPLTDSSPAKAGTLLRLRRLEKALLVDREHGELLTNGKQNEKQNENSHLALLNPGEKLFIVTMASGAPVLKGTVLDAVASYGPFVLEYNARNRDFFESLLPGSGRPRMRSSYILAATCDIEELRAHLASLMVVYAEREKSLYGPFDDFAWKKEDAPYGAREIAVDAADSPGPALRLADVYDADFFLALAPRADKDGLARLMGPIRGLWVQNRPKDATPWAELRYEPEEAAKGSVLGKSPVLALDKAALESIIAAKRSFVEYIWASYAVQEEAVKADGRKAVPDYAAKLPQALQETTAQFDELAKKGFVSPWDMGSAAYSLRRAGNDAALVETLKALRDDVSQSSAKRVRAMRSALKNHIRK